MKNPPLNTGVIIPPDDHYRPVLYSDAKASFNLYLINRDIYEGKKKAKNINEKKTPKSVFAVIGAAALALGYPFLKKLLKK